MSRQVILTQIGETFLLGSSDIDQFSDPTVTPFAEHFQKRKLTQGGNLMQLTEVILKES